MWFLFALAGYFLLSVTVIFDKIILSKSVSKPVIYTFYSTIIMFAVLLAWPLGVEFLKGTDWWWAFFSGLTFGFGLWASYIAVHKGEASHINPFMGASVTIAVYFFSSYFLREQLSQIQIVGIIILVFACFLLSFEKSRKNNGFHIGFLWGMLAGVLYAASHVSAKYIYEIYPFITGIVWTKVPIGLVGLLLFFHPAVKRSFKKRRVKPKTVAKRYTFVLVAVAKVLGVVSLLFIQYAFASGSVSLVMALSGLQFVLMFMMIYLLTKLVPRLFNEYFTKREIAIEVIAIFLVMLGSALFVI